MDVKQVWFDARIIDNCTTNIIEYLATSEIDNIILKAEDRNYFHMPQKTIFIVEAEKSEELEKAEENDIVLSKDEKILEEAKIKGFRTCFDINVKDKESLNRAHEIGALHQYVLIDFEAVTNIPLELVIAKLQSKETIVIKKVHSVQDAEISFSVMEQGCNGVLFFSNKLEEVVSMNKLISKSKIIKYELPTLKIKSIEHVGVGERACIDTTSLLKENEGMIIGSTSKGGILVSSETHFLPYMNLRPFRVNAGAVHSYVWCPNNTTEYITDLRSGSRVMVFDTDGNAREVTVGRIKIEKRPLLQIKAEIDGVEISTIVQDDWHIRVLGNKTTNYNVTNLKSGFEVKGFCCEPGRHVGIKINEKILEV